MGTGKTVDNNKFYEGFEGEQEVEIYTPDEKGMILHIWEGYFRDLFGDSPLHGLGWRGFTRDCNQFEGAFEFGSDATIVTDLQEYYDDLKSYDNKKFRFEETREVYELLCSWFEEVMEKGYKEIVVQVW